MNFDATHKLVFAYLFGFILLLLAPAIVTVFQAIEYFLIGEDLQAISEIIASLLVIFTLSLEFLSRTIYNTIVLSMLFSLFIIAKYVGKVRFEE